MRQPRMPPIPVSCLQGARTVWHRLSCHVRQRKQAEAPATCSSSATSRQNTMVPLPLPPLITARQHATPCRGQGHALADGGQNGERVAHGLGAAAQSTAGACIARAAAVAAGMQRAAGHVGHLGAQVRQVCGWVGWIGWLLGWLAVNLVVCLWWALAWLACREVGVARQLVSWGMPWLLQRYAMPQSQHVQSLRGMPTTASAESPAQRTTTQPTSAR